MTTQNTLPQLYRLSISQAQYYCRKPECGTIKDMEGYARILEDAGIEVTNVQTTSLEAKSTQGKVWTALSGLSW
ncbi:MAG: hypothetical protein ACREUA_01050 [Burkholderiales bacterium]